MSRTEFRIGRTLVALTRLAALHEKTGQRGHAINEAMEAEKLAQQLDLLAESQAAAVLLHEMQTRPCPVRVDVEQGLGKLNGVEVRLEPFAVELLALLSEKQRSSVPSC